MPDVTRRWTARRKLPNSVMTALAFLALAFAVVVPPGFMTVDQSAGPGFAIVICTGHGPLQLDPAPDHKVPPAKSKAGAACPFAANITPPLPVGLTIGVRAAPFGVVAITAASHQAPGRGLAAPPPPATGPPVLI
jgi:hypothetical protein